MPAAPRPNQKASKIAYEILKTPKELRDNNKKKPSANTLEDWKRDPQLIR
jgi:hypothetical protein